MSRMAGETIFLPPRIALTYEPKASLSQREGREAWLFRRRCDGAPFVVKRNHDQEDLEE